MYGRIRTRTAKNKKLDVGRSWPMNVYVTNVVCVQLRKILFYDHFNRFKNKCYVTVAVYETLISCPITNIFCKRHHLYYACILFSFSLLHNLHSLSTTRDP